MDGSAFICWSEGGPPREKRQKCSVCGRRWGTLLCDGRRPGTTVRVVVRGLEYEQEETATCDAPLCATCTTRPELAPIKLPDHRDGGHMNGMHVLQTERRIGLMTAQGKPRRTALVAELEPDTVDFCPTCAANGGVWHDTDATFPARRR